MEELLQIGAAYIRVSDERQDEYSPDSQLKKIREYAAREGYLIPDEYVFYDDGISGRSVKKRDDFNRMIAIAKEKTHPFDVIYVWKFSRFARNQEEALVYKNLLRKKNVAVVSVSEPIPEGHFGTLIERIIEWMDEYYSINLSGEVIRGMTEKVTRGEPICPPAFGYVIKDKKYYPDEARVDIVREIFSRYASGVGMRTIAIDLNARGIRTQRGCIFDNKRLDFILHNPVYIGKLRWSTGGTRAVHRRQYFDESIMTVDGNHEPIISLDLWEQVQARLAADKKKYPKYAKKDQPITVMTKGLIRCSDCGGTLGVSSTKSGKAKVLTFQCCNYAKGRCTVSHSVLVHKIEGAIIEGLKQALRDKQFTILPERKKDAPKIDTPDYEKLIALENRRMERARQAYLNEIDTLDQYAINKKEIEERIAKLIELRDKIEPQEPLNQDVFAEKVLGVVEFIESEENTTEAKNEALRTIIDKIVYDKANENVAIYFYD